MAAEKATWSFPRPFWFANASELCERAAYYGTFIALRTYLLRVVGLDDVQAGFVAGLFGALIYLFPFFSGALADRLGFRSALILAFALLTLGYGSLGRFHAFWPVMGALLLIVIGGSFVKPVTALCVAALVLPLVHPDKNLRLAFAVGLAVAVVTTLDLLGADFWINGWLASQAAVSEPGTVSFRMMNGMPLAFAGGALALSRFERHRFTATALGGIAAVMAVLALLTYVTGIHMLYSSVMPPALPTAPRAASGLSLARAVQRTSSPETSGRRSCGRRSGPLACRSARGPRCTRASS